MGSGLLQQRDALSVRRRRLGLLRPLQHGTAIADCADVFATGALGSASAGRMVACDLTGMGYTFSNQTAAPVSHDLQLEGYALVFTTPVPEPAAPALLMAGRGVLGGVARWRGSCAG